MNDWISWVTGDPMDLKGKKSFFENIWYLSYIFKQWLNATVKR